MNCHFVIKLFPMHSRFLGKMTPPLKTLVSVFPIPDTIYKKIMYEELPLRFPQSSRNHKDLFFTV